MLQIQHLPITSLRPADYNPRKISAEQMARLKRSLQEFGFVDPVIVNTRTGNIVGGHQRVAAAEALGMDTVPVVEIDLDDDRERALNVALNKHGGEWDYQRLPDLLAEIQAGGIDLELTGFTQDELDAMIAEAASDEQPEGLTDPDDVPEAPEEPITKPGDLWILGRHRLLCGDSTVITDVERLMDGRKADAVLTDPPYGTNQPGVPNDSPEEFHQLMLESASVLPIVGGIIVAFQSPRTFPGWLDAIRSAGHKFERMLWLYKQAQMAKPWRGWLLTSEAILVSTVGAGQWHEINPYSHDCYMLPQVSGEIPDGLGWHGSVKPQSVLTDLARRIAPENGLIFDGFLGSGSTLIACQTTGQTCYGIEKAPTYCDVIVKRWEQHTGQTARLEAQHGQEYEVHAGDGQKADRRSKARSHA